MKPSQNITAPIDKGNHPELDTSELCTEEQISRYQSMIGSLQWILSKHWGYSQIRDRLKSLLFWKRETANIIVENSTSQAKGE
jgi:hypothetical protein